ncbi:6443_t:CDS:2 [Diversispora eburnea]|uniref:6443_t:CDS:1 n=1 Tax=Diversispora eburnea TaxID=1213867 RepID=A0A9N9APV1_9GLOM|nr:6443_t:CDS:2 [Diversispora eburnea]
MDFYDFIDENNAFGNGIPYREGKPIKLLQFEDESGRFILNQDALNIINKIEEPISIIAVAGAYRCGKSWIGNVFHGRHDGFELGAEVQSCTRGIDMWDSPFIHEGKRVIILDCEGFNEPKQDQLYDTKLFVLCLIISSIFVYNINAIVGKSDISKLFLMTDLTKYVRPTTECQYLPRLVVLIRNFGLKSPENFREYFLEKLEEVNVDAAKGIKEHFSDCDVYGLSVKRLQYMDKVPTQDLDPCFVSEIIVTVNQIYQNLEPKYIGSSAMSGIAFARFITECVKRLNDPENNIQISIPDEYSSVTNFVARKTTEKCEKLYKQTMEKEIQTLPIQWDVINFCHSIAFHASEAEFFKSIIGSGPQILEFLKELHIRIENIKSEFYKTNSEALLQHYTEIANNLWEMHVKSGLRYQNLFSGQDEFEEAIEKFEKEMDELPQGPEVNKVFANYKSKEYKEAIELMEIMGKLQSDLANNLKSNQENQQKLLETLAEEEVLNRQYSTKQEEYSYSDQYLAAKLVEMNNLMERQRIENLEALEKLREEQMISFERLNRQKDEEIARIKADLKIKKNDKEIWLDALNKIVEFGINFGINVGIPYILKKFIPAL